MSNDFPRMLYKADGSEAIHGGHFQTIIVEDEEALDAAKADGWHMTTPEALAADTEEAESNAPATRAELEAKATELGIKFDGRSSDKKLADMIAAQLED